MLQRSVSKPFVVCTLSVGSIISPLNITYVSTKPVDLLKLKLYIVILKHVIQTFLICSQSTAVNSAVFKSAVHNNYIQKRNDRLLLCSYRPYIVVWIVNVILL